MTDHNAKLFSSMFDDASTGATPPPTAPTGHTTRRPPPSRSGTAVATPTKASPAKQVSAPPPSTGGAVRTRPASANKAPRIDPLANMVYEDEDDDSPSSSSSSSSEETVSSDDDDAMKCAQAEDDGHISVEDDDDEEEVTLMRVETPRPTATAISARSTERDAELSKRESALESRAAKLDQRARELDARDTKMDQRALEQEKKEGEMKKLQHALRQANEKQRELYQQNTATLALLDERINKVEELEKRAQPQQAVQLQHLNGAASPSPMRPHTVHLSSATQTDYESMIPEDVRRAMWVAHAVHKRQFDTNLYSVDDGLPGAVQSVIVIERETQRVVYSQTRCNQL